MDSIKEEIIYCVKCRKEVSVPDPVQITMRSGRLALTGKCPKCGTKCYKITGASK